MELRKLLASCLVVVTMVSVFPLRSSAAVYEREAKMLQTLGVLRGGPDGSLYLDKPLTRLEAVVLAIRFSGKEDEALSLTEDEVYLTMYNVRDNYEIIWGREYAAYAIRNKIITGTSTDVMLLSPNSIVSGRQFFTMVLRSLGDNRDQLYENVEEAASDHSILTDNDVSIICKNNSISRDLAALILFGTLRGLDNSGTMYVDFLCEIGAINIDAVISSGIVTASAALPVLQTASATPTPPTKNVAVFRGMAFDGCSLGLSRSDVEKIVYGNDPTVRFSSSADSISLFKCKFLDYFCSKSYHFAGDKLDSAIYFIDDEKYTDISMYPYADYPYIYKQIVDKLSLEYGTPTEKKEHWLEPVMKKELEGYDEISLYVAADWVFYYTKWTKENTEITVSMFGQDLEVSLCIDYSYVK